MKRFFQMVRAALTVVAGINLLSGEFAAFGSAAALVAVLGAVAECCPADEGA